MPSLRTRQAYDRTALLAVDALVDEAQAAADAAQAAADAAQGDVDALEPTIPPSGTIVVSSDTTLSPDDITVLVDSTGGNVTVTLGFSGNYTVPVVITKTVAANSVDIVPGGIGDTLNGGAGPVTLTAASEQRTFVAAQGATAWFG